MGSKTRFVWKGPEVADALTADVARGLRLVGAEFKARVKDRISTQGPPPSSPGEPPHKDSGDLYGSIYDEPGSAGSVLFVRVGSPLSYAAELEFGNSRMAARPILREVAAEIAAEVPVIISRGGSSVP